jgi:splicing factor U2AF subunit
MANYLASIFGTEQDKVNCSFYYKIGACRHGDRCSRKHVKPSYSQTILLPNLYQNPAYDPKNKMNPQQMQMHFDAFYEDIWCELCHYGLVEEVVVCDNNNDRKYILPAVGKEKTLPNSLHQYAQCSCRKQSEAYRY